MFISSRSFSYLSCLLALFTLLLGGVGNALENQAERDAHRLLEVRIRYAAEKDRLQLRSDQPLDVIGNGKRMRLEAGAWQIRTKVLKAAVQCWHVFAKTFPPQDEAGLESYLASWRQQGYHPTVKVFGKRFLSTKGVALDNRLFWVSLAQYPQESDAKALVEKLKKQQVWAWIRPETLSPGYGVIAFHDQAGAVQCKLPAPLLLKSSAPIKLDQVDIGYLHEKRADLLCPAPLSLRFGPGDRLEAHGVLPLESYLRGVVPAEMSSSWPMEALKAQAVAARSEVMANLHGKHHLEGFDCCACEHCRAYTGVQGYTARTDAAIEQSRGQILVHEGQVVETVFSACCGGWSENNEVVWSGPAKAYLRGLACLPEGTKWSQGGIKKDTVDSWLRESPPAYCRADQKHFRWQRRYSLAEASRLVNSYHRVGTIQSIQQGERGLSGRLKWLTIRGASGQVTLKKELAIRKAFGGLPSAMCIISLERAKDGSSEVRIRGGGRGHGVGMCQYGARGMAQQGWEYGRIVGHYFSQTEMMRFP